MSTLMTETNSVSRSVRQGSVLIANDSRVQLESLRHFISSAGFDVTVAEDGKEALDVAKVRLPDLIISDVVMPGMGGVELCRRIKLDPLTADIPVLLLTALRYDDAGVLEGLEAGADDYLQLDAPPSLLQKKTERLVASSLERKARKEAEQALTDNEERFRLLIENTNDVITLLDPDGAIKYISPTVRRLLGYDAPALIGRSVFEFIHPDDVQATKSALRGLVNSCEYPQAVEHRVITPDGSWRWFETNAVNMLEEPTIRGLIASSRDIGDRRQAVESLRQAVDLKEAIFQGSRDGIFISDPRARFVVVNSAACELTGYDPDELLKKTIPDLHEDVDREAFRSYHSRIMAGEPIVSQARLLRKDGSKIDVEFNNRRVCISGSEFMHTVARDLTERTLANEALRKSEERYRAVVDQSANCIFLLDVESRMIVDANPALVRLLGYTRDELLTLTLYDLVVDERSSVDADVEDAVATGNHFIGERLYRTKDGIQIDLEVTANTISYGDRTVLCVVALDVTDQKKMERALKESEERFRDLFENANDIIYTLDLEGRFTSVNKAAAQLAGYPKEKLIGMSFSDLIARDQRPLDTGALRRQMAMDREGFYEGNIVSGNGSQHTVEVRTRLIMRDGVPVGIQGIARNVTERRIAEEKLKQFTARLEKSNRELESFAYIASHDLQEPLRKVQAFGDRLLTRCGDTFDAEGRNYLARMQNAAMRMQTLITDLLILSRVTTKARPFTNVDLAEIVGEVISDLEVQIEQTGASVTVGYLPIIEADSTQMRQLFQNLIGNAVKFHKPGVGPAVKVADNMLGGTDSGGPGRVRPDGVCEIVIQDNGIGFDAKHSERIFAPFQRLHGRSEYEGTGIGLAVCRKIVERHGGNLEAESERGKGSRFVVTLPIRQSHRPDNNA